MGWRDGLRGEGRGKTSTSGHQLSTPVAHQLMITNPIHLHQLTEERPDCSVDPHCSKNVGQSDVEGVLCAGLQSHDEEETAIPCNLVGSVEGAVNKDSDI